MFSYIKTMRLLLKRSLKKTCTCIITSSN